MTSVGHRTYSGDKTDLSFVWLQLITFGLKTDLVAYC